MAELLTGKGNPSGKLADTFAADVNDYPSTANFHESFDYVNYTEDIYVGYRYFETLPGAQEKSNLSIWIRTFLHHLLPEHHRYVGNRGSDFR